MRWKLVIITSFVAALVNAGGMRSLVYWLTGTAAFPGATQLGVIARVTIIPLVIITLACVFVYRHTARRRKLQAALTVLFALVLTCAALLASRVSVNF